MQIQGKMSVQYFGCYCFLQTVPWAGCIQWDTLASVSWHSLEEMEASNKYQHYLISIMHGQLSPSREEWRCGLFNLWPKCLSINSFSGDALMCRYLLSFSFPSGGSQLQLTNSLRENISRHLWSAWSLLVPPNSAIKQTQVRWWSALTCWMVTVTTGPAVHILNNSIWYWDIAWQL